MTRPTQSDARDENPRIQLAFRRLQLAFLRAGYEFGGAARIVEDRADRDDNLAICDEPHAHWWTEWAINEHSDGLREDRFCFRCGSMETQEIRGG